MPDRPASYRWIETSQALEALVEVLQDEASIAIDTESNSMHAYSERVCLVQVSTRTCDALIDPFGVDIAPLGEVLADPAREKVFHAADYDILCLKRDYGFEFERLFDTMLAARVLGWERNGLAPILADQFGVRPNKKFQRYDWGRRPLEPEALEYARQDTHYLLALRDVMAAELLVAGKVELFEHACERQTQVEPKPKPFDPTGFWRIKGARDLDPPGRSVLAALFALRERWAEEKERPLFRVFSDSVLTALANRRPGSRKGLGAIKGVGRWASGRWGDELLETIARAQEQSPPEPPPRPARPDPEFTARYEALRSWRRERAERWTTEPDIVLPKTVLVALARGSIDDRAALEASGILDPWELERFSEEILEALQSERAKPSRAESS